MDSAETSIQSGMNVTSEEVFRRASPSDKTADRELSLDHFVSSSDEVVCSVRQLVTDQAVEAHCCQQFFCATCTICYWLDPHRTCRRCRARLMAYELATSIDCRHCIHMRCNV